MLYKPTKQQRIIYVEPNDVYDKEADNSQGDLSLTPKYEDFCISFNLIIEQFSRMKSNGTTKDTNGRLDEDGNTRTYNIEWGMTKEDLIERRTSLLSGTREINGYNYLTTYYTDLTYNSYKQKTEIEGLGVESVQISYESWYTPTIVIKFIDVRGSSIFGREEAIHVDEKLMAENVFGAFFSMPYPLFRLQVKGFFGKPVTYQLTCSSFKGEFNSQTGNFEAVATFIGYSWSLLTDIPFTYLVAAPHSPYIGKDYWERHKNSKEWALWHDGNGVSSLPPPRLSDFFKKIDGVLKNDSFGKPTEEQSQELSQMGNERGLLNDLITKRGSFINALELNVDKDYFVDNYNQQIILFSSSPTLPLIDETRTKYEEYYQSIKSYETSDFKNGKSITIDKSPNKWIEKEKGVTGIPKDLSFFDVFKIETDIVTNSITNISLSDGSEPTQEKLQLIKLNENGDTLSSEACEKLLKTIKENNPHIKRYCYLINTYEVNELCKDRIVEIEEREKKIVEAINEQANLSIVDLLGGPNQGGFKPFIGNVFKMIFCHLETFCHIMFKSAEEIYEQQKTGERSPKNLGIDFKNTDIKDNTIDYVTPWPAIYNKGQQSQDCGYISNANIDNVFGWVGDFKDHLFIEEKVVYGLQEGIEKIVADKEKEENEHIRTAFPIMPFDFIKNNSVFSSALIGNVSELSGHLANRIAQIFGVLTGNNISEEMSTTLGRLDAYNLFSSVGSVSTFSNIVNNIDEDTINGIMYCKEQKKYEAYANIRESNVNIKWHDFETAKMLSQKLVKPKGVTYSRHPFFVESKSDKDLYVHFYDKQEISLVPATIKGFNNYKSAKLGEGGDFIYDADNGNYPYFIPNITKATKTEEDTRSYEWLHLCNTSKLNVLKENEVNLKHYVNKSMFDIITDDSTITRIKNKYSELKSGNIKVMEYEVKDDLSKFLDTFLYVGNNTLQLYFEKVNHMLSGNASKLQLDRSIFLPKNENVEPNTFTWIWYETKSNSNIKNSVVIGNDCEITFNEDEKITLNDLVIQDFRVKYQGEICNLFGCPFYYLQNEKANEKENDEKIFNNRVLLSKAYLFLHTFQYSTNIPKNFLKRKTNGSITIVPKGLLLLLGALLWRKRYYNENNYDPIVSSNSKVKFYNPGANYSFLKLEKNRFEVYTIDNFNKNPFKYYTVNKHFSDVEIDYNIENQLISLFKNFATGVFREKILKYELKWKDNDGTVKFFNYSSFIDFIKLYYSNVLIFENYKEKKFFNKVSATSKNNLISLFKKLDGLYANYNGIRINPKIDVYNQGFKMLFNEDNTDDQKLFKDLYCGSYLIVDNCYKLLTKNNDNVTDSDKVYVKKSLMKSYLSGFVKASQDIINSQTVNIGNNINMNVSLNTFRNRNLSLPIYYYLKNLWDKWLVIANENTFDVTEFFDKNFVFIDSFYKNTYHLLAMNCEILLKAWNELADNGSLFHFLSYIVDKHGCIFLPVPDYVGFNGKTQEHDIEMMKDLFRPLPYCEIEAPSNNNKFIVMYTHSPSHVKTEQNNYVMDSYDLWTHEGNVAKISNEASELFKSDDVDKDAERENPIATREGYNVPSFGVAFARQNNHIFKNLRLTMDNPVMTEQAIKAQWQIAMKGSSDVHSICFIGQDTFNVFSNYSYSITIDMMGNAQICPLMYFQLLNVPLWKGTYMIYKVVHNMTPGNMVTTITGMKMNKFAQPFNTSFFTIHEIPPKEREKNGTNDDCSDEISPKTVDRDGGNYGHAGPFTNKTNKEKFRMCGLDINKLSTNAMDAYNSGLIKEITIKLSNGDTKLKVNKYIEADLRQICKEILELGWFELNITNCWRTTSTAGRSRHKYGIAVDVNAGSSNPWFNAEISKDQKELKEGEIAPWGPNVKKGWTKSASPYNRKRSTWHWGHPVVKIFLAHGWGWGGSYGDVMHFSIDGR